MTGDASMPNFLRTKTRMDRSMLDSILFTLANEFHFSIFSKYSLSIISLSVFKNFYLPPLKLDQVNLNQTLTVASAAPQA
jgi:hypothetical protein